MAARKKAEQELSITYMELGELETWPRNPKLHDSPAIQGSIRRFGFLDPIALNEHPKATFLLEGHGRLGALREMYEEGESPPKNIRLGEKDWLVPVVKLHLEPTEAEAYAIAHNQLTTAGGWDKGTLSHVMRSLDEFDVPLSGLGFTDLEVKKLLEPEKAKAGKVEPEENFSPEFMEAHNYVLLYFDNEMDWLAAKEKLNIVQVECADSREGYRRRGTGRVLRGADVLAKIT